jgi:predicted nucleic acid-binding Zn ribbon protein
MKYDYECPGCGDKRIIERPMAADEETYICDHCDTELKRDYGVPAISFRGPGFYSTDNPKR